MSLARHHHRRRMRTAVTSLDLEQMLRGSGISTEVRVGLMNWRGSIVEDRRHAPAWTSHDGGATI